MSDHWQTVRRVCLLNLSKHLKTTLGSSQELWSQDHQKEFGGEREWSLEQPMFSVTQGRAGRGQKADLEGQGCIPGIPRSGRRVNEENSTYDLVVLPFYPPWCSMWKRREEESISVSFYDAETFFCLRLCVCVCAHACGCTCVKGHGPVASIFPFIIFMTSATHMRDAYVRERRNILPPPYFPK